MNFYAHSAMIAFILFGMGMIALVLGTQNYIQNRKSKSDLQMFLACICVFFWDAGYAWMSLCFESDFAYIPRAVALLAVYLYVIFILGYVAVITGYSEKKLVLLLVPYVILAIISWPQIIRKDAVYFVPTVWGYWYHSKMTVARLIQFACVIYGIVLYCIILRYGRKSARIERERLVVKRFGLFVPILFVGYTFDTLIPSVFHMPAVPGSGVSAFIAAMILFHIARINRVLGVSKENVSKYVFDDVKIPVIVTNNEDRIVICNNYTFEFLGFSGERVITHKVSEFFSEVEEDVMQVIGSDRECILESTDIIDKFGDKIYTIFFVRDVTEERNSYRLMQQSMKDAEEANKAKSEFLANMSHEIRTPMNAIIGMSQIIVDNKSVSDEVLSQANEIKIASTNLLGIINDILDMSKIEAGKFELVNDDYDLAVLIHEISSVITVRLRQSDVNFVLDIDETLPRMLYGDVVRIRQILMNVLGNAIKFTKTGSIALKVTWNKYEQAPDILFDITDTGIGIKPEDKDKIFGKYDQVDQKKNRNIQGTGLGLAISRNLAIIMGGMITVDSVYGEGSTFHIVINQDVSKNSEAMGSEVVTQLQEKTFVIPIKEEIVATQKTDTKVLVVDDSRVNLLVATGLMKKYEMQIDTAMSGREAIKKVKANDYDIVFMDHMMPEMDGVEAMHAIRDLGEKYRKLTIIALTANALSESKELLLNEGFEDFLAKPINVVELDRIINTYG